MQAVTEHVCCTVTQCNLSEPAINKFSCASICSSHPVPATLSYSDLFSEARVHDEIPLQLYALNSCCSFWRDSLTHPITRVIIVFIIIITINLVVFPLWKDEAKEGSDTEQHPALIACQIRKTLPAENTL